jgi:hypothetical protein
MIATSKTPFIHLFPSFVTSRVKSVPASINSFESCQSLRFFGQLAPSAIQPKQLTQPSLAPPISDPPLRPLRTAFVTERSPGSPLDGRLHLEISRSAYTASDRLGAALRFSKRGECRQRGGCAGDNKSAHPYKERRFGPQKHESLSTRNAVRRLGVRTIESAHPNFPNLRRNLLFSCHPSPQAEDLLLLGICFCFCRCLFFPHTPTKPVILSGAACALCKLRSRRTPIPPTSPIPLVPFNRYASRCLFLPRYSFFAMIPHPQTIFHAFAQQNRMSSPQTHPRTNNPSPINKIKR